MALEHFLSTLSHLGLLRHLLAVDVPTLKVVVSTSTEYLQMAPNYTGKPHPQMAMRSREEDEEKDTPNWGEPSGSLDSTGPATRREPKP